MHDTQLISILPTAGKPRHAQQEIVDLLAAALLRLRARHVPDPIVDSAPVALGFCGHQRVNANPDPLNGVRR